MTKLKRSYSQKTIKVLFASSGNQCAHPDCINQVIIPATEESDALVLNQICHIYAVSEDGPRGKPGLTDKELNHPSNLILLCPTHHTIIDGQHESYPAEVLLDWKRSHEEKMQNLLSTDLGAIQVDVLSHPYFPKELVDQKILEELTALRKARFYAEFDGVRESMALGNRLIEGVLSGGSDLVRCRALSWCARLLCLSDKFSVAEEYLEKARILGDCPEVGVSNAFLESKKGDKAKALKILSGIESPIALSAALMIVANHEGADEAITWLDKVDKDINRLDSDGKHFFLLQLIKVGRWKEAELAIGYVGEEDLEKTPILLHMIGMLSLLSAIPEEYCGVIFNQIPFEAAGFPLASDQKAIDSRRKAQEYFVRSVHVAQELDCPNAATIDHDYDLWLELRDPENSAKGYERLELLLRDYQSALRLVPLGLQFRVNLDLKAVAQEIDRQIALHGEITRDAAIAKFALAFIQKSPEKVANYISQHFAELSKYLDKKAMGCLQIQMLCQAGLPDKAGEILSILLDEGVSEIEERQIRSMISEAQGTDSVEARMAQFKHSGNLSDLNSLVDELEKRECWEELCVYGALLFEKTHALPDAERLANAYSHRDKSIDLVRFIDENKELVAQSRSLQLMYCWGLYNEGELLKARNELKLLTNDRDNPSYRALQVNICVALGDWDELTSILAYEYQERNNRSPQELLISARLAYQSGSPYAKELLRAATEDSEDPSILAGAYFLASSAGWEGEETAGEWLQRAVELSGSEGPLKKVDIDEVIDQKPDWDRRASDVWQQLSRGDIPAFVAAEALNKTLLDLTLIPALANSTVLDPRYRQIIPAYSGKRTTEALNTYGDTACFDATALLTLSYLKILDKVIDTFSLVYVPHTTLSWLFDEKQKVSFHQPSRIKEAHDLRNLYATESIEKLFPSTVIDSELSAVIGDELALLICEAEKSKTAGDVQKLVVRSSPIHCIGSLMKEEADLTGHAKVLVSCQAVVGKLRQKGQVTLQEEKKAEAYLKLHENPWENEPNIVDGAILYLDSLSVTYFQNLGLLGKIKAAGLRPVVPKQSFSEANALISYESISSTVNETVDYLRSVLSTRIETGQIKVGRRWEFGNRSTGSMSLHPTAGIISSISDSDIAILDDRFLNQHQYIGKDDNKTKIVTTLELIDAMVLCGDMTIDECLAHKTTLRRAGYILIPISEDELTRYLIESDIQCNNVVETAELKAIRENILRVRMSDWLQIPKEGLWLDSIIKTFIRVLRRLWKDDIDLGAVIARSDWIIEQIDIRGWAHCYDKDVGRNIIKQERGSIVLLLLSPIMNISSEVQKEYWNWIEDRILLPIKEQFPDLFIWLVDICREQVINITQMDIKDGESYE